MPLGHSRQIYRMGARDGEYRPMDTATNSPSPFFFKRLVEQMNPHQERTSHVPLEIRLLCGRWIALHRLRLNRTLDVIVKWVDISRELMLQIETGLADRHSISAVTRDSLQLALISEHCEPAWVANVIALALGDGELPSAQMVSEIQRDLDQLTSSQRIVSVSAPPSPALVPARAGAVQAPARKAQGALSNDVWNVLSALAVGNGSHHSIAVTEKINEWRRQNHQKSINFVAVNHVIASMRKYGWLTEHEKASNSAQDGATYTYYKLTEEGLRVYKVEGNRRHDVVTIPDLPPHTA